MIYAKRIFDWSGIKQLGTEKEVKEAIVEQASEFMKEIAEAAYALDRHKISGPDGALVGANPVVLVTSDTVKQPDRGYETIFDEINMRQSSNDSFDLIGVTGGVTFYQLKAGEEVKISKIPRAAKTSVSMLRFAGGLNVLDDWIKYNKFYLIDQLFEDTIRRWWGKKADLFYGLLAALGGGVVQAFDTDDLTTINNACAQIITDCAAAGLELDENPVFTITCNQTLKARILKALAMTFQTQGVNKQIVYNVGAVVTTPKIVNTSYYVSLPGLKNQRGEWEDLNARPAQRDEQHLGALHVWTGAYNGVIGEAKQHRRCSLS